MGFLDKVKGAVNAVTGGAAKVTFDFEPKVALAGENLRVKVSVLSTGAEVKSGGVFVDLRAREEVHIRKSEIQAERDVSLAKSTFDQGFQVAPEFVLAAGETKHFEGGVSLPADLQPSFKGAYGEHFWEIRARVEAFGNDPDSGWVRLRMGIKS